MRTSELERFQSHRRKSPFRSRSRRAAYMRRWWWRRKLRNMGVPECMLDETVEKMLRLRERQYWDFKNPGKNIASTRRWMAKNAEHVREYQRNYHANKQRADRQKMLMAMGG